MDEMLEIPSKEVRERVKASLSRMLLALYAAQRVASGTEEQLDVAAAIAQAEKLERETMAFFGEPSQIEHLRELIKQFASTEELALFLGIDPDEQPHRYA